MIKSMTAFARSEKSSDAGSVSWEIRSVNSRYLDLSFRLPEEFRACEGKYRELVAAHISRGKVECSLRYNASEALSKQLDVDEDMSKAVVDACQHINNFLHQPSAINPIEILSWPGVVRDAEIDLGPLHAASIDAMEDALVSLVENRKAEGERIEVMLSQRCDGIQEIVDNTRPLIGEIQQRQREKIAQKIEDLGVQVDKDRLEQELVYMAQKTDVDEELDRLHAHLVEIRDVLTRDEPVGRRLDFLMQELNREANTLGSKSIDIGSTKSSVDLKVLIEQMREQIQNIE